MTVICPDGHESSATDYCDSCGAPIGAGAEPDALCPACGAPSRGRFCEQCGHDSALPAPRPAAETVAAVVWVATVTADREFYDRVLARKGPDADQVGFPAFYPERRIVLHGNDILIGKRSVSQGLSPGIDLGIAPADVGVSRAHATLHLDTDGLTVTDLGSTNGTSVNGSDELIPARVPVRLRSGDRIHLGGWTTIVFSAEPA